MKNCKMRWDGWDGMGWDGMGWDGMRWDEMKCDAMRWGWGGGGGGGGGWLFGGSGSGSGGSGSGSGNDDKDENDNDNDNWGCHLLHKQYKNFQMVCHTFMGSFVSIWKKWSGKVGLKRLIIKLICKMTFFCSRWNMHFSWHEEQEMHRLGGRIADNTYSTSRSSSLSWGARWTRRTLKNMTFKFIFRYLISLKIGDLTDTDHTCSLLSNTAFNWRWKGKNDTNKRKISNLFACVHRNPRLAMHSPSLNTSTVKPHYFKLSWFEVPIISRWGQIPLDLPLLFQSLTLSLLFTSIDVSSKSVNHNLVNIWSNAMKFCHQTRLIKIFTFKGKNCTPWYI